jgi:hypothetical protein
MAVIYKDYANIKVGTTDLQRLYAGNTLIWELESPTPTPTGYSSEYFTTIVVSGSRLYWSGSTTANTLSYSKNDGEWSTPETSITLNVTAGDVVRWKGVEGRMTPKTSGSGHLGIGCFAQTTMQGPATFDCQGNVMSLLYGDNFSGQTNLSDYPYAFDGLLSRTQAREIGNIALPATTLSNNCYTNLFQGCTATTTAPSLPATTMRDNCYQNMFNNCFSLTTAPQLPATTLAYQCYNSMFAGCSGLTQAPSLIATTIVDSCYTTMFSGCSSLVTPPQLQATRLATNCYKGMFCNCSSLAQAPQLPATTLTSSCYREMFKGCSSLRTAPDLLAVNLTYNCYDYMFSGCTRLNYIKAMFTTTPSGSLTNNWVNSVSTEGTFVKNANATWNVTGVNGVPTNWTIETAQE